MPPSGNMYLSGACNMHIRSSKFKPLALSTWVSVDFPGALLYSVHTFMVANMQMYSFMPNTLKSASHAQCTDSNTVTGLLSGYGTVSS